MQCLAVAFKGTADDAGRGHLYLACWHGKGTLHLKLAVCIHLMEQTRSHGGILLLLVLLLLVICLVAYWRTVLASKRDLPEAREEANTFAGCRKRIPCCKQVMVFD